MALVSTSNPYEFLVRWDDAGVLHGMHLIMRDSVTEDGVEKFNKINDPRPVALTDAALLGQIGATINTTVLAANAAKDDEIAAGKARIAELEAANAEISGTLASVLEAIKTAQVPQGDPVPGADTPA